MTEYPRIVEATIKGTGERKRFAQVSSKSVEFLTTGWGLVNSRALTDITPVPLLWDDLPQAERISEYCITAGIETWSGNKHTPAGVRKAGREYLDKYRAYEAAARLLELEESEKQSEAERLQQVVDEANEYLRSGIPNHINSAAIVLPDQLMKAVRAGARLTLPKDGDQ